MTGLKQYPAYKDSGARWLGEVPTNWPVVPAKTVLSERKERSLAEDTHLTPSQTHGVLPQVEYMERTGNKVVLNLTGADAMRHVEPNDFISHLRSFQGGLEHSRLKGKVSAAYTVLRPRPKTSPEFLRYLLKSSSYIQALQTTTDQLRDGQSIRFGQIALLPLPLPALDEQRAISGFLDRETAEIDAFIADQEELIGLLSERRSATISHFVTKGLDLTVSLKDSGHQQIGRIPDGWRVWPFTRLASERVDYRGATPQKADDGILLITARNVRQGLIDYETSREFVAEKDYEQTMRRGLPSVGDILLTMEAPLGNVALIDRTDIALAQRIIKFRVSPSDNPAFVKYFMMSSSFQQQLQSRATGSTALGLKASKLPELRIARPEKAEQDLIVNALDRELSALDGAIQDAREATALSRERRAALISAAVTGKIDVREHALSRS